MIKFPDPYDLLGVSPKSTLKHLKKAYYNLSLLCHPDKGGNASDMIILRNAYQYIKDQFENQELNSYQYQELEDDFQNFCQSQEEKPPPFSDIYHETNEWIQEFHREFDRSQLENINHDPFQEGYGLYMDPRENLETEINQEEISRYLEEDSQLPVTHFERQIQVYQEPNFLPDTYGKYYNFKISSIDDFSELSGDLKMSDYKKAFTPDDDLLFENNKKVDKLSSLELESQYQELENQRNSLDLYLQDNYLRSSFLEFEEAQKKIENQKISKAKKLSNYFIKELESNSLFRNKWFLWL